MVSIYSSEREVMNLCEEAEPGELMSDEFGYFKKGGIVEGYFLSMMSRMFTTITGSTNETTILKGGFMKKGLFSLCLFALVFVSSAAFAAGDDLLYVVCVDRQDHSDVALARAECDAYVDSFGYVHGVLRPRSCVDSGACKATCTDPDTDYECDGVGPMIMN